MPAEERAPAVIAAANEAARSNPMESLEALAELEPSSERDTALTHAVGQWAALDPNAAVEWAAAATPGHLREQICSSVAISMADSNPSAAAQFVADQMADGIPLRTAAISVVQRWAQRDLAAVKAWAAQFPAGGMREDALREIEVQRRAIATTD